MPTSPQGCEHVKACEMSFHGGHIVLEWCPDCGTLIVKTAPEQIFNALVLALSRTPATRVGTHFLPSMHTKGADVG